jgi:hypothetical protein
LQLSLSQLILERLNLLVLGSHELQLERSDLLVLINETQIHMLHFAARREFTVRLPKEVHRWYLRGQQRHYFTILTTILVTIGVTVWAFLMEGRDRRGPCGALGELNLFLCTVVQFYLAQISRLQFV